MKRMFFKSLATIGVMGLAYYLYNPRKYNKAAKKAATAAGNGLKTVKG